MFSSSQEAYIADLDAKSGASLKLTLLNPRGRIWTMVAGGGASVVYRCLFALLYINLAYWLDSGFIGFSFSCSDTICDLGGVDELANYGEYSGAPSEQQTYDYAKTILSLMTRERHPEGEYHVKEIYQLWLFVQQRCWNVKFQLSTSSYSLLWSPAGKVLIIGGSIANFTNVAATFKVKLFLETLYKVNFRTLALSKDLSCDYAYWNLYIY